MRILPENVRSRRGRPLKDAVRLVTLSDPAYARQLEVWLASERAKRREPLWSVTDEPLASE